MYVHQKALESHVPLKHTTSAQRYQVLCARQNYARNHLYLLLGQGEDPPGPTGKGLHPSSNLSSTLSQALIQTAPFVLLNKWSHSYRKSQFEKIHILSFRKHSNGCQIMSIII